MFTKIHFTVTNIYFTIYVDLLKQKLDISLATPSQIYNKIMHLKISCHLNEIKDIQFGRYLDISLQQHRSYNVYKDKDVWIILQSCVCKYLLIHKHENGFTKCLTITVNLLWLARGDSQIPTRNANMYFYSYFIGERIITYNN